MALVELEPTAATELSWSFLNVFYGFPGLVLLWLAWRLLELLWWQPRRTERELRAQGLHGTSHRFLSGDLKDYWRLNKEAWSRPLALRCHDIAPRALPFLYNIVREHGKTCVYWSGPTPSIVMSDPGLVKEILADKVVQFGKLKFSAVLKLLANGIESYEGEKWVRHKNILMPAFNLEEIKDALPAISECCEDMLNRWKEYIGNDGSCELDVSPELKSMAGDMISRTAFGSSYIEGMRVFQLQTEQLERLLSTFWIFLVPGYVYLPTKNNRRMHQINKEIEATLRDLIGKRIQAMGGKGKSTKRDMLGLLLQSNMSNIEEKGQSSSGITIEEVIEHCKVFYLAGSETVATLLTWTMVVLSMHPQWQDKAREEVLGLFGKNKPKYEHLSRLKNVTMILHEVLRLYPPATVLKRKLHKESEVGGVRYPAGVMVDIPVLLIHHDSDFWGSDAQEFRPERFAEGISKASKKPGAFLPFGWGPRICMGQNMAMLEAKMALCMILQHFEFELASSYSHAPHVQLTLQPMHGAQIKLRAI